MAHPLSKDGTSEMLTIESETLLIQGIIINPVFSSYLVKMQHSMLSNYNGMIRISLYHRRLNHGLQFVSYYLNIFHFGGDHKL